MRSRRLVTIVVCVVSLVGFALLPAETTAAFDGPPGPPAPPPAPPPAEKPDFPKFEEAMKDYTEVTTTEPPFISLWYKKKDDSLRAQIPAALLGKQFLVASSMSGGPVATGFQLDHFLAYLERMDKRLVLMRVDPRYAEGGNKPVADVIRRSYGGDIILKAIDIVTMNGADPIIDLDGLFKTDFAGIGALGGGTVDPRLSKWSAFKAFPENIELSVDLAFMRGPVGRRNLFHYSISKIPESAQAYQPRAADDRIGYFLTVRKDWSKDHEADTLFDRYINRWRLEKRDPSLELSAPKHPIIWYIEKTVPLPYRRWVKDGILEWNKAFEKCGFLDAIEVIQQEDYDPRTKDLDPEDVRYNFFRWIVTGRGFAMGPSRAHPLTGQIFDADIVFDDSMVRHYLTVHQRFTAGGELWQPYGPVLEDFFRAHPCWMHRDPLELLLPNVRLKPDPDAELYANLHRHMHEKGRPLCCYAAGMAQQLQFARIALEARGLPPDSEEFLGQVIKEIVMHEVGHCLGLRHNFKGSTWLPMAEVAEHQLAGDPNVGSIMDYNPLVIAPRDQKQGSFTTRSIGPYDYWAIEYGYRPVAKPYSNEQEMLQKIASRCAEAGLDYATDEDTMWIFSPDPTANQFDMGRDIPEFARRQISLSDSLLKDIKDWAVKDGQSYDRLRRAVLTVLYQRASASTYVARFAGGLIFNRHHKGDPDARLPLQVVEADAQREATRFVCDNVFAENAYQIDPGLLSRMGAGRWSHWDSDDFDLAVDVNIHDFILGAQYQCLFTLLNPFTIRRVHDNEVRFDAGQAYTLGEHLTSITDAIWAELRDSERQRSEAKAFIHSYRRNLQRKHLDLLFNLVLTEPGLVVPADASAVARHCLVRLHRRIPLALAQWNDVDTATRSHLEDVQKRIEKILEAEYAVLGSADNPAAVRHWAKPVAADEPITILPGE